MTLKLSHGSQISQSLYGWNKNVSPPQVLITWSNLMTISLRNYEVIHFWKCFQNLTWYYLNYSKETLIWLFHSFPSTLYPFLTIEWEWRIFFICWNCLIIWYTEIGEIGWNDSKTVPLEAKYPKVLSTLYPYLIIEWERRSINGIFTMQLLESLMELSLKYLQVGSQFQIPTSMISEFLYTWRLVNPLWRRIFYFEPCNL